MYYHPTLNPTGTAPPGKPQRYMTSNSEPMSAGAGLVWTICLPLLCQSVTALSEAHATVAAAPVRSGFPSKHVGCNSQCP